MANGEIPNFMPKDWSHPEIGVSKSYGVVKKYLDGVKVVIPYEQSVEGFPDDPQNYETFYPDGSLHWEVGIDEDGSPTEGSLYIQDAWVPKSTS